MKQIMLIEDDRLHRKLYGTWLEAQGYEAVPVDDETRTLEMVAAVQPCLAIIDLRMPRIGGLDLVKALRADLSTADVPILVLTVCSSVQDRIASLAAGANGYIQKSGQMAEFLHAVKALAGPPV